jgi:hypothetical protein
MQQDRRGWRPWVVGYLAQGRIEGKVKCSILRHWI